MSVDTNKLHKLYAEDESARCVLDHFAGRERNRTETTVDRLLANVAADGHNLSRGQIIQVLKTLEELGCGEFKAGRKGHQSRFEWHYGLVSIGRAAAGETPDIEAVAVEDDETEGEDLERMLDHRFQLRPDLVINLSLPQDLTKGEASRVADFVKTLPFEP